ncbi:MAG: hypothetical protein J7J31_09350 [Helicobacteraceae bacterium]|nr:hypothetical protein [Helicobacteraceae bacterium]
MKLFKTTALSLLLATSVFAESKTDMAEDMRTMLSAMQEIEAAGFYNNKEGMHAGVKKLKSGLKTLLSTDAKEYLPDEQAYANKFAKKNATMITMYADDLIDSLNHNKMDDALENYALILKQCTSCHIRIRSY